MRATTVKELISILQSLDPDARLVIDGPDIGGYDVTECPVAFVQTRDSINSLNHTVRGSFVSIGGDHIQPHDPENGVFGKDISKVVEEDPTKECINPRQCKEFKWSCQK